MRCGQLVPTLESFRFVKTERATEIDDANSRIQQLRGDFRRYFVPSGQECGANSAFDDGLRGQSTNWRLPPSAQLRKKLGKAMSAVRFAHIKRQRIDIGMAQKNFRQLKTRIAGNTYDRDIVWISHFMRRGC